MSNFGPVTPILRIFDEAKAREFYIGFLDFEIQFEHRFGNNFPLYMGIKRGDCHLHLSEHHGDACPGSKVRIKCADIKGFCKALQRKDYKYAKPGSGEKTPWNTLEVTLADPFGNKLVFTEEA